MNAFAKYVDSINDSFLTFFLTAGTMLMSDESQFKILKSYD